MVRYPVRISVIANPMISMPTLVIMMVNLPTIRLTECIVNYGESSSFLRLERIETNLDGRLFVI